MRVEGQAKYFCAKTDAKYSSGSFYMLPDTIPVRNIEYLHLSEFLYRVRLPVTIHKNLGSSEMENRLQFAMKTFD